MKSFFFIAKQASCVLTVMLSITANAADYFVSPAGNDTNSGISTNFPFQTFAKGISVLQSGDILYLRSGTYRESVTITKRATVDNPITISAYNNENVIIKGSDIVTGWTLYTNSIYKKTEWIYESQQVFSDEAILDQLGHVDPAIAGNASDGNWMIETNDINPNGMTIAEMYPGSFLYDKTNTTLYVWLPDNSNPATHTIEANTKIRLLMAFDAAYIHIKDITFRHNNGSAKPTGALVELGDNCTIENCKLEWGDFAGVAMGYKRSGSRAVNCIFSNNGNTGIGAAGTKDFTISNCTITSNNYRNFNTLWHAGGIKMSGGAYGTIEKSTIANNNGSGIWLDYCNSGGLSSINNNYIHNNGPKHAGVFLEVSDNINVYNNIIENNIRLGITLEGTHNTRIFNNEIIGTSGVSGLRIIRAPVSDNYIFNNVFYNNDQCDTDINIAADAVPDIYNNIVDYNLYFNTSGNYSLRTGNITFSDLTTWQNYGYDTHGITANPDYLPGSNCRKSTNSPTTDTGINAAWITNDYFNTTRPYGSNIDIGAFENNTSTSANIPPIANAGTNQIGSRSNVFTLNGTESIDNDGTITDYIWKNGTNIIATGATSQISLNQYGLNLITLYTTDNNSAESFDYTTIEITATEGPIGFWKFEEPSGITVTNSTTTTLNGELKNGTTRIPGKVGSALYFDGIDDYVLIDYNADAYALNNKISVTGWFNREDGGGYVSGIEVQGYWRLTSSPGGPGGTAWTFSIIDTNSNFKSVSSSIIPYDEWHHIAGTYDGNTLRIYIDGTLDNSSTVNAVMKGNDRNLRIGVRDFSISYYKGKIDEVKMLSSIMTDAEIWDDAQIQPATEPGFLITIIGAVTNNTPPPATNDFHFTIASDCHMYASHSNVFKDVTCTAITNNPDGPGSFLITNGDMDPFARVKPAVYDKIINPLLIEGKQYYYYPTIGNHDLYNTSNDSNFWTEVSEDTQTRAIIDYNKTNLHNIVSWGPDYTSALYGYENNGSRFTNYSFDYGDCHFVVIDLYYANSIPGRGNGNFSSTTATWLNNDLTNTDKSKIIVFGHEPAIPYTTPDGVDITETIYYNAQDLWDIMKNNNVNAYFCGHTHQFGVVTQDGITQINTGSSAIEGNNTYIMVFFSGNTITYKAYIYNNTTAIWEEHNGIIQ